MLAAMDVVGNPSSVHAEGRAAKMIVERARAQVAELVGCKSTQVIFTGSATEAAALAVAQKRHHGGLFAALPTEHDCLGVWSDATLEAVQGREGVTDVAKLNALHAWVAGLPAAPQGQRAALVALSAANSETGIMWSEGTVPGSGAAGAVIADITQVAGKAPVVFEVDTPAYAILSAHKLGGPKGVGALINFTAQDPDAIVRGGGQESGRRSGTENVIGIAGFGAAAAAAGHDVAQGRWGEVAHLRDYLETAIAGTSSNTIFIGRDAVRLPNTSMFLTPGWKAETQVMQMDLAGFAVSAGSACSSGKVRSSKVLTALGYDAQDAACAIRVSLGLDTTKEDVQRFARSWAAKFERHDTRAA